MYVEMESFDMVRGLILGSSVSHVCSLEDGEFSSLFSRADVRTRILESILTSTLSSRWHCLPLSCSFQASGPD